MPALKINETTADADGKVKSLLEELGGRCAVKSGDFPITKDSDPVFKDVFFVNMSRSYTEGDFYGKIICETSGASPLEKDAREITRSLVSPKGGDRNPELSRLGDFDKTSCTFNSVLREGNDGEDCRRINSHVSAVTSICRPPTDYRTSKLYRSLWVQEYFFPCAFFAILPQMVVEECSRDGRVGGIFRYGRWKKDKESKKEVLAWVHDFNVHALKPLVPSS
ncbi:hypothetical protein BJ508DRAFT_323203 [Ascobolus immersus RN42]|uniref:Uncharacterized protein n=1 Tax=Ascobolus immersus RN42 TaxID=1160509 RepID=A0A3N4IHB5_ASCIM|nr:hypothetical protein BJ508DRAFT_323203 [Ascobolus immersus RN42]